MDGKKAHQTFPFLAHECCAGHAPLGLVELEGVKAQLSSFSSYWGDLCAYNGFT